MTEHLLAVTGAFVPYNDTVTLISYKHLRLLDYQIDVIALRAKEDSSIKKELEHDPCFSKFNIEYITDYDKTIANLQKKNVLGGICNIIKYLKAAKRKVQNHNYKVIYSSSLPAFTHLAAYMIKKHNKDITWVASFSDPLVNSPYKKDKTTLAEYNFITKIGFYVYIAIYMNNLYERLAMKYADRIIYISEEQRDFMINNNRQFGKDALLKKALIIPLNYIENWSIYNNLISHSAPGGNNRPLIATHFGRIYGLRKIDAFLLALKNLKTDIPDLQDKLVFEQYGEIIPRYKKIINDYGLEKIFKINEKVAYSVALDKMKNCDILLLFDTLTDNDDPQPYLPSKTLEYLLLRKPIMAICQKNSPAHRLLNSLGYQCLINDATQIYNYFTNILNNIPTYDYDISSFENTNVSRII